MEKLDGTSGIFTFQRLYPSPAGLIATGKPVSDRSLKTDANLRRRTPIPATGRDTRSMPTF